MHVSSAMMTIREKDLRLFPLKKTSLITTKRTTPSRTNTPGLTVINAIKRVLHMQVYLRSVSPVIKTYTRVNLERTASVVIISRVGKILSNLTMTGIRNTRLQENT